MNYYYAWHNNSLRAKYYKQQCKVLVRGKMNSCLVEFEDGFLMVTSRNALRRIK